jgi:glycosyltransferase involved in cell wall biosynthesis
MKVLKVIHGFPPDYMAGSEVYSYHLVKELINQDINVTVFTRVENEFDDNYKIYEESYENINIVRVNKPKRDYLFTDKYYDEDMDRIFEDYLKNIMPDIVHMGHLSHLSTNFIKIVKKYKIPIVYTIHDFWLYCVKGQLINKKGEICSGPSIDKCFNCSNYVVNEKEVELIIKHMNESINMIDKFISPSITLKDFFVKQGICEEKIAYLKYGFNTEKIKYNRKVFSNEMKINFGFMGRVIPTKGIKVLVDCFKNLENETLSIYGGIGVQKRFLETENIKFKGSYNNNNINEVLNDIDVLIVPSIWLENAPLVIQEAFLAGIPVITSNLGGMSELVKNGVNGYTFEVGNSKELEKIITMISNRPEILNELHNSRDLVVDIKEDVKNIVKLYEEVL